MPPLSGLGTRIVVSTDYYHGLLGSKEEAKARTLKVLFEFVGLEAEEILELGKDLKAPLPGKELPEEEIQKVSDRKLERSILLQSAGTKLTKEFRNWWNLGYAHEEPSAR